MYISDDKIGDIELLINKAINIVESIELNNCFVPKAKDLVINKLEESLMWIRYKGRSSNKEIK